MLFSTPAIDRPKKTRKHGAKVKTGCKTCKIRRVKCDERKPSCSRCTSTGRKCDGYATKEEFEVQIVSYSQAASLQRAVSSLSGFGENVHYLEFYYHCARPTLCSTFDYEFWSRIALQMAHSEPSVRHALIALSYLHKTESGSLKHARSEFVANHHRRILFSHYNKSVRYLVNCMTEPSYTPEIGLVTCILFICIEYLRANYHTAFIHMTNGLKILSEWEHSRRHNSISPQSCKTLRNGPIGSNTWIEDKVKPLFIRGITSALLHGVDIEKCFPIPCPVLQNLREQPFKTLLDAQSSSHELRNATILYMRHMSQKLVQQIPATAEDLRCQDYFLGCHNTWYRNLELLEAGSQLSREDIASASTLKVSYYTTYIYAACAAEVDQKQYDAHIESFKALIHHTKIVIASMNLTTSCAAKFTFEISIIAPLYFVACYCRCPTTRREAVSLLRLNLSREGLWDAQQHVIVSNRVIEMEESEVDLETGWPVERTRLWSNVIDANMDRNGGFWVHFLPAIWVGEVEPDGKPKILHEWFVL
ncbi:hypothetical protein K505DRAFT_386986 [Melanomma pulvis-pyrius CBS 109.77]|uniref:Zn(2)-C6 fungal-type domain-containing protein n=1 Tax=Melanomma pulvis-pyrius CBS 109.77 TaxID=1314802 RepID=A0A6A6XVH5_9PLEO|nr:hypothetical protein K505DRAFT_386986 [Melanomma pulvis-pyrius CBS 109.77]